MTGEKIIKNNSPSVKNNIEQTGSNQIHLTKISVKITLKYSEVLTLDEIHCQINLLSLTDAQKLQVFF